MFGASLTKSILHTVSSWMCAGCGTAAHGRSPTLFQPSSTSRPTATCLQMGTTWYPAVTALGARAVRPRWDPQSCSCTLVQRMNQTDSRAVVSAVMVTADKCQPVQYSLCFFITGNTVSERTCRSELNMKQLLNELVVGRWNEFCYEQADLRSGRVFSALGPEAARL